MSTALHRKKKPNHHANKAHVKMRIRCLCCKNLFLSEGKHDRLCELCGDEGISGFETEAIIEVVNE